MGTGNRGFAPGTAAVNVALGMALTGQRLPCSAGELLPQLEAAGWSVATLSQHRRDCDSRGCRWPHRVAPDDRAGLGPAQWFALLGQVLQELGLGGQVPHKPAPARELTRDEQRLVDAAPPHAVGKGRA